MEQLQEDGLKVLNLGAYLTLSRTEWWSIGSMLTVDMIRNPEEKNMNFSDTRVDDKFFISFPFFADFEEVLSSNEITISKDFLDIRSLHNLQTLYN